jgi:DNA-binding NarL/FixJ family response regulator
MAPDLDPPDASRDLPDLPVLAADMRSIIRQSPKAKRGRRRSTEFERKRILIVEDEPWIALDLEHLIADAGYEIAGLAQDANEALHIAKETRPALVLMDVRLAGERDGIDAASDIFESLGIRSIFVSAHFDRTTRRRAEAAKPYAMLDKPIKPDALIAAVKKALGGN